MSTAAASLGALSDIDDRQLQSLYKSLWDWELCTSCTAGQPPSCCNESCPGRRERQLGPFKKFYKTTTSRYLPEFTASQEFALRNHDDLIDIIRHLRNNPAIPRRQLIASYFSQRARVEGSLAQPHVHDQERAVNLAARILTMVNCSIELNQIEAFLEEGTRLAAWSSEDSLAKFMASNFPITDHPSLNDASSSAKPEKLRSRLEARHLTNGLSFSFRATDNLADHLRLDPTEGCIVIFHHTRALKEFLIATRVADNGVISPETYLPRQLALEVIDSIQKVLFPLGSESEPILRSLISKHGFDPDCLRLADSYQYRRPNESDVPYHYFGSRLMDLLHELDHPTPRTTLEKWLERRSGARYVMLATLAGVGVAILLGFLALVVSIFQAWISWQAWKHPVPNE